eukprot:gene19668-20759_t
MSLTRDATGLLDTSFERESGLILEVTVIRAENLKAMDANGLSEEEDLEGSVAGGIYFICEVWDKDTMSRDDMIGFCRVYMPSSRDVVEMWHTLTLPHGDRGKVMLRMQWNGAARSETPITGTQLRQQHLFRTVCPPSLPAYQALYASTSSIPSLSFPPVHEVLLEQQQDMSLKGDDGTLYLTTFRLVFVPYSCVTDRADSGSGGSRSDSKSKSSSIMDVPRRLRPQIVSVPIGCIAHCSDAGAEKFGLELVCKDARHLKFGVSD